MRHLFAVSLAALTVALSTPFAAAQDSQNWMRMRLAPTLRPEADWGMVWPMMLDAFRSSNPSERGVSEKGIEQLHQIAKAQRRAQVYAMVLSQDLDADGQVTRDELIAFYQPQARRMIRASGTQLEPTEDQVRQQLDRLVANALRFDADRDGVIRPDEIRAAAQAQSEEAVRSILPSRYVPMSLDEDRDGFVSRAEYEAAVRREFANADINGDGRISAQEAMDYQRLASEARRAEAEAAREAMRRTQIQAMVAACRAEKPPAGAKVVLLGGYEGRTLSNVSVGGDDREVSVANVEVAPGPEPLFIVATSYDAMVWRFAGATDRIAGVLVHSRAEDRESGGPRAGVTGLPKEKVRFTAAARCLPYFTDRDQAGGTFAVEAMWGKGPEEVGGVYGIHTMQVPGARHGNATPAALANVTLPDDGAAANVWRDMLRFYPAGLANIDPSSVVSSLPVKRYEVLPQQAGLAQLVEEGALKIAGTARSVRVVDGAPTTVESPNGYLIIRKMRFPAGLNGAQSVRFILARDIPMPEGDPGQSCVISEEDGRRIAGRPNCR